MGKLEHYEFIGNFSIFLYFSWLSPFPFFNKGPMHYKDRQQELEQKATKTSRLEDTVPEVRDLLDHMEEDFLFRHKVLVYFYEYKKGQQSPEEGPFPPVPAGE